jgi:hypothetical protein
MDPFGRQPAVLSERVPSTRNIVALCLAGVAAALLLVGLESGTIVRHIIQIIPIPPAIAVAVRRPAWGALVAIPIFLFWSLIMILIWLFVLGISRVASGDYTAIELALTAVIALFSVVGIVASGRLVAAPTWSHRVVVLCVFALAGGVQFAAMWTAFLPPFAYR